MFTNTGLMLVVVAGFGASCFLFALLLVHIRSPERFQGKKHTCDCVDIEMGSYDNQVLLGFYPVMREYRKNRLNAGLSDYGIPVDRCIADQVVELWEAGIRTYGCCCGHNQTDGFIHVGEDYDKAIALGWEGYNFPNDEGRLDTIKPRLR